MSDKAACALALLLAGCSSQPLSPTPTGSIWHLIIGTEVAATVSVYASDPRSPVASGLSQGLVPLVYTLPQGGYTVCASLPDRQHCEPVTLTRDTTLVLVFPPLPEPS